MTEVQIRQAVPLRTLHGIELAAVGTWKASTGETTFTAEDFAAAVAALECPGVRNPVIKLGHAEADSDSGVRWDGEPAVGWIANMRFDGAKIVGDLTGVPAWMADPDGSGLSVLAAAYPDRSIEIWRPFVCQIGHTHPSVITALSLLGVYAPGVGVLKSMQDVYAAFTMSGDEYPAQPGEYVTKATDLPTGRAALSRLSTEVRMAAAERRELSDIERRSGVDLDELDGQWQDAVDTLLDIWPDISEAQRDQLAAQIADAVDTNPDALAGMQVDSDEAGAALLAALVAVAALAAAGMVAEVARQGVTIPLPDITEDTVHDVAGSVAATMAASTASTAGRSAAQALGTGTGEEIAHVVDEFLKSMSDTFWRDQLGGAVSAAQAAGRLAVVESYEGTDQIAYYASEALDGNTCVACREIDLTKFDSLDSARAAYGSGKYVGCLGRERCRGHLITIFGSDQASAAVHTTIRTTLGGPMPAPPAVVKASVSVEDISRKYYEAAGYSMYITAMHVDPLELIAADDSNGKFYRIPVELSGEEFQFGEPQEVAVAYQDVAAASAALPVRFADRRTSLLAAGKNPDGSDRIAPDVSPAGAAIRKAAAKTEAPVLEIEVPAEPQTPDADPATGPTNPKEASVDAAKMREALGLGPDATDDEVRAKLASELTPEPAPETDPLAVLTAKLPAGERPILVDPENYKSLLSMAVKGEQAYAEVQKTRGQALLAEAAREGRFPVSRLSAYQEMWDKNPAETEAYINLMPKNTVPTLASGVLGQEISQNESDQVYAAMYGQGAK